MNSDGYVTKFTSGLLCWGDNRPRSRSIERRSPESEMKKIALVNASSTSSQAAADTQKKQIQANGGTVTTSVFAKPGTPDYAPVATQLVSSNPDVIITGVRAYERRGDLRAYNRRLLDYAERGGTAVVQYNKFEFNQQQFGPYPAVVSASRVSDERAPVKPLVPSHPVFNFPNKIGPPTWANWVQERGLYFLGEKDPKYVDLVSMTDSFQDNPGEKLGSFVEARVGKGRWIYLGLGLWRQLPAGTDGAYQLLANILALPRAGGAGTAGQAGRAGQAGKPGGARGG